MSERWTDTLLYVKNVGENVTEDDLKQVFTECEDIVIAKTDSGRKKDKQTKSVSLLYMSLHTAYALLVNPFIASCSMLLLFEGFSTILF